MIWRKDGAQSEDLSMNLLSHWIHSDEAVLHMKK